MSYCWPVKRILVIGNPGAGKSTLSIQLGRILSLDVIHLDKCFWQRGWIKTDEDIWQETVRELVSRDMWVIDGSYHRTLDIRLPRADTIIFLDFKTTVCLFSIFKRVIFSYGKQRLDMADGCPEKFDPVFVRWIIRYRRDIRPIILDLLTSLSPTQRLIVLKNRRQVREFLSKIEMKP